MPFSAKIGFFSTLEQLYSWPGFMTDDEFSAEVDGDFTSTGPATYSLQTHTSTMNHRYGLLAPNGNVYFIPRGVTYFLEFDPTTDVKNNIVSPNSANDYTGGALADNGNICCPQFNNLTPDTIMHLRATDSGTTVAEIEPTGDYNTTNIGGVTLPSGNVMFMPRTSGGWFTVYDADTNIASKAGISTTVKTLSENFEFVGGVSHPNGNVYWMPFDGQTVSYYNEASDSWTDVDVSSVISNNSDALQGGVLMTDGRIVGVPYSFTELFVFDPSDDSFYSDTYGMDLSGTNKYIGGALAPNGNVYFANFQNNAVDQIEFDTQANVAVERSIGSGLRSGCIGVVPTGDDRLLFVPTSGGNFTEVDVGKTPTNPEVMKSPQLNKGG